MTFLEYILSGQGDFERFDFKTADEAYQFGIRLRDIIEQEGDDESIQVEISNTVVRVRLMEMETALA